MIKSYGEWIDIVSRGTSGDQVMDILASWRQDAYKHISSCNKLEKMVLQKDEEIARLKLALKETGGL